MDILHANIIVVTKNMVPDIERRLEETKTSDSIARFSLNTCGHYITTEDKRDIIFDWCDISANFYNENNHLRVEFEKSYFDEELLEDADTQDTITKEEFLNILLGGKFTFNQNDEETAILYIDKDCHETEEEFPYDVTLFEVWYKDDEGKDHKIILCGEKEEPITEETVLYDKHGCELLGIKFYDKRVNLSESTWKAIDQDIEASSGLEVCSDSEIVVDSKDEE